jgi:putative polymerase
MAAPLLLVDDGRKPAVDAVNHDRSFLPVAVVVAAVSFNAVLAVINGHVSELTPAAVISAEILIVAAVNAWAILHYRPIMNVWYALLAFACIFAALRMLALGFNPKYLRDMALVPSFALLGLCSTRKGVIQAVLALQGLVVAGIALESILPDFYAELFRIKSYYINTRGIDGFEFTNVTSDLYISATRPEARYLPFFGLHRLSSVFLEPVSLGNFAALSMVFATAFWRHLRWPAKACLGVSIPLALFACDGRLAMTVALVIFCLVLVARFLTPFAPAAFLPVAVVAAFVAVDLGQLHTGEDTLSGRVAHTVFLLRDLHVEDYFGLSDRLLEVAVDSGLVYIIITQSIFGLLALWLVAAFAVPCSDETRQRHTIGICFLIASTMMVSYSLVSIKTAAPLWFVFGSQASRESAGREPTP